MITNVSMSMNSGTVAKKNTPSFGFAKLSDMGKSTADSFEFQHNDFLDGELFRKQGIFKRPALYKKIVEENANFSDLCREYGCTKNPKANADFIKTQIISSKAANSVGKIVDEDDYGEGLVCLYNANYNNPELSVPETRKLLDMAKDSMSDEDYVQHAGILEVGTE